MEAVKQNPAKVSVDFQLIPSCFMVVSIISWLIPGRWLNQPLFQLYLVEFNSPNIPIHFHVVSLCFIIMWATGYTRKAWKTSHTILIDKNRADETSVSSYRPIGLANTLYKLWTRMITNTLYEYAEAYSLLSTTQAGFRRQKRYYLPAAECDYGP